MSDSNYPSDIRLGEKYRDDVTGFVGTATSVTFFLNACERVGLEAHDPEGKKGGVEIFDAPRLTNMETNEKATSPKTGGVRDVASRPGSNSR